MSNKVKEAKKLIDKYGLKRLKAPQLVQASTQLDKSLLETLQIIAYLKSGGQGAGPFPHTTEALKGKHA